ncbi:MAG: CD225/dispanin family protein [Alistipes sp.]|nr:CD225/dispanin family protein [Alistipes sp.]
MEPNNMQKPDNALVWAILSTVLCCLPFGIVAIVKATQVDTFWAAGNVDAACQAARDARKWCWISAGTAVAIWVIYFIAILATIGLAAMCNLD